MAPTSKDLPKLYSMTSIGIATFFCSLLAGGYLIYANYKALGMRSLANYTLGASLILFLLLLWVMSIWLDPASVNAEAPGDLPRNIITINLIAATAQAIIAVMATQFLQGAMLTTFNEMNGTYHSTWWAFFVGFCAAFVLSMLLALLASLLNFR